MRDIVELLNALH